jgi:hypothetical protein
MTDSYWLRLFPQMTTDNLPEDLNTVTDMELECEAAGHNIKCSCRACTELARRNAYNEESWPS